MEDSDTEWEVQEYSPSKEGEVTKVRWILNKGLWLGKKVVITGVAISSAPLVLPPLVVCSAMGFAFSVPFGLVFASYACTDKLMSKLLPTPEPSSILEYYTDEDEEEGKEGFGKFVMEEEEEEDLEDIKRGVGMRIYMDENDDYWQKDVDSWEEQPTVYSDENVTGEGYEEDVGGYWQKDVVSWEEQPSVYNDENVKEEGYEEDVGDYWQKDADRWEEQPTVYSDGNVEEEGYEEDVGEYVEVEDDYAQEIEIRDEKQEEDTQEIEIRDEKHVDTLEIEMRDERQGEDYKEYIGEIVVEDDNVEEIEVREEGDGVELVIKGSKDEEQLVEMPRVVVVVRGNKEKHGNDGQVTGLNLVVREVKGALEIKDEPVGNEVQIGLDEIESPAFGMEENLEREGNKEDVGEYVEGEDKFMERTKKEVEVREVGDRQKLVEEKVNDNTPRAEIRDVVILVPGNEDNNDNARELEELDLETREVIGGKGNEKEPIDNEEDIVRGSTGLLERIRDGNLGNDVTGESCGARGLQGVDENEGGKSATIRGPIGEPLEEDDVLLKKLVEEVKETGDRERAVEETPVPFEGGDVKSERPSKKIENIALEYQKRNVPANVEQVGESQDKDFRNENTIGYVNGMLGAKSFGGDLDSTKKQKPEVQEKLAAQEARAADNDSIYQAEKMTLKKMRENVISSNADMREIADESGFDLFDERSAPSDQNSYAAMHATDDFNESTIEVNVDFMALPTTVRVFDSSHVKNALEKDEVPSSQVLLKEEKIWEQIDAMRAIVGYGATPHRNFREELEALYIFTGVEPPASSKDPSDLADINHKLRFLMSIVGVK